MALVGIVILSAQTILQGTWTERWRIRPVSEQEEALAARLQKRADHHWRLGKCRFCRSMMRGLEGSRTVGYYGRVVSQSQ